MREQPKKIGGTYEDRMINDRSRYLSHSRENFSNIVLSVLSGNGISILAGADKRRSRAHRAPHSRSRQFPKRAKASENEEREKPRGWSGGRWCGTRAANSSAGRRRRATNKRATEGPGAGGWQLHRGFDRRTAKGDEDFVQGSAFRLGRRGRDCPLLW